MHALLILYISIIMSKMVNIHSHSGSVCLSEWGRWR